VAAKTTKPARAQRGFLVMLAPLYLWTLAFVALPIGYVFFMSVLKNGANWGLVYELTLGNYARIADPLYLGVFAESARVALMTTVVTLLMAYPFAYFMARMNPRRRNLIMLLVVVPFWTSALARTYGWMILMRNNGLINQFLLAIKVIDDPLKMLYTEGAVLVGMAYSLLPFMILPIYASLEKLDWACVEAARDLGAAKARALITVTVPLTLPGVVSGCVLVFIPSLGLFFISDLLGGAKHMMLGNLIHNQLTTARDWPFGAALSVVMIAMTLSLLTLYRRVTGGELEVL